MTWAIAGQWAWKHSGTIALTIAVIAALFWFQGWLGRHDAAIRKDEQTTCRDAKLKADNAALSTTLTIKRRQDANHNAPRDDARFIERVQQHKY